MNIMRMKLKDYRAVKGAFDNVLKDTHEQLCFIGVRSALWASGRLFLVEEMHPLNQKDYQCQSAGCVEPRKEVQDRIFREMLGKGLQVWTIHTHLGRFPFSSTDRRSVLGVARVLKGHSYGNVIFNNLFDYFSGRFYNPDLGQIVNLDRFEVVGNGMELFLNDYVSTNAGERKDDEHHRQYLIPGLVRRRIESSRVAVIGLGGNGAAVLEHLACIGFGSGEGGKIFLVDDDIIESSNLARIPYAWKEHIGMLKVHAALKYLKWKAPESKTQALPFSVLKPKVLEKLKSCTMIFGCTDSESSRKVLNELSVSCLIPYIDLGCGIIPGQGSNYYAGGQVRTVIPATRPCLVCANGIDHNQAVRETFSEEEKNMRIKAGYIEGFEENPTASILHLNTTIASQAVSQTIKLLMGEDLSRQFYLVYDQRKGKIRPMRARMHYQCPVCGPGGILGTGVGHIKKTHTRAQNIPAEIPSDHRLVSCLP
jgi:molybdopterin/thiamine biosynthesis adenylyltransferase